MCTMKNLTLRVEEDTLAKARVVAAERSTSVNGLIREFLDDLVSQEAKREQARRELISLCQEAKAESGEFTWNRDAIYDR